MRPSFHVKRISRSQHRYYHCGLRRRCPLFGHDRNAIQQVYEQLNCQYKMKMLREVSTFLGLEIKRDE